MKCSECAVLTIRQARVPPHGKPVGFPTRPSPGLPAYPYDSGYYLRAFARYYYTKNGGFMSKEDIIRKLTSRKFWLAVAAFVTELIIAFKGDAELAETHSGMIMA